MINKGLILRWTGLAIIIAVICFVLINKAATISLESRGKISLATFIRIDPYFKGGPDLNFKYEIENKSYDSFNQVDNENDRKLKLGDRFYILYLPNRHSITKIIRDNNGKIILYRDNVQLDSIKQIFERK